jgi:RNA polymerase sigma factor for flagellar operon FliA
METVLSQALSRLEAADRLIVRMRYWQDMSIADIARALGLPQKPLYRRIERALAAVRRHLERAGVSRTEAATFFEESSRL